MKPNRDLSNWIWNCIHIDDLNKATIMPLVRAKEEAIAQLEKENKGLSRALDKRLHKEYMDEDHRLGGIGITFEQFRKDDLLTGE